MTVAGNLHRALRGVAVAIADLVRKQIVATVGVDRRVGHGRRAIDEGRADHAIGRRNRAERVAVVSNVAFCR